MNIYPSFTNTRSYLSYQFSALRRRALWNLLWGMLTSRKTNLAVFPEEAPEKSPNRKFLGVQDISVHEIIGTLNRESDFDYKFRPLHKHLQDRWIHAYLALQSDNGSPILVHKVGNKYYVEDGHHRVSVAQELKITFIQAKVWEYPSLAKQPKKCQPAPCPEPSSTKLFVQANK